ncbi:MAG: hypothetical protein ABWY01_00570 [Pseudoxanthomonas sp.]
MHRVAKTVSLLIALVGPGANALAAEPDHPLSGRYGHDASEPAYAPVWELQRRGEGWLAVTLVDGQSVHAYPLSSAGRAAFWKKMNWAVASAADANCISWGEAPPDLLGMLQESPGVAPPDTFGEALICHVPAASRRAIDWLAGATEDWFYYDPVAGVMQVRQLR